MANLRVRFRPLSLAIGGGCSSGLTLTCGVFESVFDGGGPSATAGVNDGRGNSDETGDNRVLQGFHTALVLEEILNLFHLVCSLV